MADFLGSAEPTSSFSPIDYEAELNEQQRAAVQAPEGPALVLAGAGSGKTRTLTYRVAQLLERGVWPNKILLLTFTNKAAREMLERVEQLTGVPARQFWGGTFHSVGQRVLRIHGDALDLDKSFTIMDQGDSEALLGDVIRTIDAKFLKNKDNPKVKVIFEIISYARNTCQLLEDVIKDRYPWLIDVIEPLVSFLESYTARKRERNLCDYDDLLELWNDLLERNDAVREQLQTRWHYVMVDEFQDTNKLQGRIVTRLGEQHRNVMVVGDNWQCIYTWRGAEFSNMQDFADAFPEREIYKIETNYRSCPEILHFANRMMLAHPPIEGYPLELQAARPANRKPRVIAAVDTRAQAQFIIRMLPELKEQGYSLKDVAVLYRAHYQAMDLQMELSRLQVPFTITSGVRFFEQAHIRDYVAQLRYVANPKDDAAFVRMAALLPKIGAVTAGRLQRLAEKVGEKEYVSPIQALTKDEVLKKVPKDATEAWTDLAYTLQDMEEALGGPPASVAPETDEQADLFAEVKSEQKREEEARSPEEVVRIGIEGWYGDYLRNVYDNWQSRRDDLDSLIGFAARYDDMNELLRELVLLNSETSDRKIDPDAETMKLTTIHQAKGLEFPIVFVLGMADELFPLKRAIENDDLDEERRLFYVAVTRAMDELFMVVPRVTASGGPPRMLHPSRFLTDLDTTTFEQYKMGPDYSR